MGIIKQTSDTNLGAAAFDNDTDLMVNLSGGSTEKITFDELMKHHSYVIATRAAYSSLASATWVDIGTGGDIATSTQRPSSGAVALRGSGVLGDELVRIEDASLAGTYWMSCRATIGTPSANGSRMLDLTRGTTASGTKANHTAIGQISVKAHGSVGVELACSALAELAVGDTIKGWLYQTTTTRTYGSVVFFARKVR